MEGASYWREETWRVFLKVERIFFYQKYFFKENFSHDFFLILNEKIF